MRKVSMTCHAIAAVFVTAFFGYLWFRMIFFGEGGLFDPFRTTQFLLLRLPQYLLVIYSLVAVPVGFFSACRFLQLKSAGGANLFSNWKSLRGLGNAFLVQGILLLYWVILFQDPSYLLKVLPMLLKPSGEVEHPRITDEHLMYPELPLSVMDTFDLEVFDRDGEAVSLKQFQGKTIFLRVWAPWNEKSTFDFPNIQRLYRQLKDERDIVILTVAFGAPEDVWARVDTEKFGLPLYSVEPHLEDEEERDLYADRFLDIFPLTRLPMTAIVAPDGKIAFRNHQIAAWDKEKTVDFLKKLSAQSSEDLPTEL